MQLFESENFFFISTKWLKMTRSLLVVGLSALYLFASNEAPPYIPPFINTDCWNCVIMRRWNEILF